MNQAQAGTVDPAFEHGIPVDPPPMNRYLTFDLPPYGQLVAVRIFLVSLMHQIPPNSPAFPSPDFTAYEGQVRWVGPVMDCQASEVPPTIFKCALPQCDPYYTNWATDLAGLPIYIFGSTVIPSSIYDVQVVSINCQGHDDTCTEVSTATRFYTFRWGDVASPFQIPVQFCSLTLGACRGVADCPPGNTCDVFPLTQPNIADVAAVVDRFKGLQSGAPVWLADINPQIPNFRVDIADVADTVDAFKGMAYYFQPGACP